MNATTLPIDQRLSTLIEPADEPRLTLCMPTHLTAPEREQDPIRFRNLLRTAEEELTAFGMRRPEAETMLAPASDLLDDSSFWRHQRKGLAVFVSNDRAYICKLPYDAPELVHVNTYFAVRHVVPLLTSHVRFLLLAVSQSEVRLFESRGEALNEIELPKSKFEEFERYLEPEESLQHHTGSVMAATRTTRSGLMYHGHGTDEPVKERAFEFFRRLNEPMRKKLEGETAPMILVGDKRVLTIFRHACTYPHMAENEVHGNPEHLNAHELMDKAQEAIQPMIDERRGAGRRLFEAAKNESRASVDIEQVLLAAYAGKLDVLLANRDTHVPGEYDEGSQKLTMRDTARPHDSDLLELAIIHTLRHGGQPYVLEDSAMPGSFPAAGVLRRGLQA